MVADPYWYRAQVTRVVDADTLEVAVDVGFRLTATMPLRIAHVDAPESRTTQGKAATAFVAALLGALPASVLVHTFKPIDKYGRYLADVYAGDKSIAIELLRAGLAVPYEGGAKA